MMNYGLIENFLRLTLQEFDALLLPPVGNTPIMAGHLMTLNGNSYAILEPSAMENSMYMLDAFQDMGLTGVTVQAQWPTPDPAWHDSDKFLKVYSALADELRKRRLYAYWETTPVIPGYSDIPVDYGGMDEAEYLERRTKAALALLDTVNPDELTVSAEPDTERWLTGYGLPIKKLVAMAMSVKGAVKERRTRVVAGVPITFPFSDAVQYEELDRVCVHIYPISVMSLFQDNMLIKLRRWADMLNKPITIGEAWLLHAGPTELVGGPQKVLELYERDYYRVWEQLDSEYMQSMITLALAGNVGLLGFFWTLMWFAYYDGISNDPETVRRATNLAGILNMRRKEYTLTGQAVKAAMLGRKKK